MLFTIQDEERAMRVHWKAVEKEALERGIEQGRLSTMVENVASLMRSAGVGAGEAMDMLAIPEAERSAVAGLLEAR